MIPPIKDANYVGHEDGYTYIYMYGATAQLGPRNLVFEVSTSHTIGHTHTHTHTHIHTVARAQ